MKKHHYLAIAIVIIAVVLVKWPPAFLQNETVPLVEYDELDKVKKEETLKLQDERAHFKMDKLFAKELYGLVEEGTLKAMDPAKLKVYIGSLEKNKESFMEKISGEYEKLDNQKTETYIKLFEDNLKNEVKVKNFESTTKTPNYSLIVAIIIIAGLLGGYARRYYPKLQDVIKLAENANNQIAEIKKKANDIESELKKTSALKGLTGGALSNFTNIQSQNFKLGQEAEVAKSDIEELIEKLNIEVPAETKDEAIMANLLFGIIASSLSFVALKASDSDVLKFQEGTDYLILWAWCCMFSIFAKNLIESLVGSIKGKISK